MNLLWLATALLFIFMVSRYNESNKLFWTLFTAMMLGFAGHALVSELQPRDNNQDKESLIQMPPTQGSTLQLMSQMSPMAIVITPSGESVECPNFVSKGAFGSNETITCLSSSAPERILRPPQIKYLVSHHYYDTS